MKINYFLQDLDGDKLRWENVAADTEIPVAVDSIIYASTETPGEYELNVFLRSRVAKPTRGSHWAKGLR